MKRLKRKNKSIYIQLPKKGEKPGKNDLEKNSFFDKFISKIGLNIEKVIKR